MIEDKRGVVLNTGFAEGPVTMEDIEGGRIATPDLADASALVAYARAINLESGDVQRLVLEGPEGTLAEQTTEPLNRNKAQWMLFVGKRRPAEGWPDGTYFARYTVLREGKPVIEENFALR